jgi:glucan 1,3-beta-glucosidase
MRVAGIIALLAAAMPAVATRGTFGLALGNQNPDSSCKTADDYKKDFDAIKHLTTLVRTYSASDCDTAKNIVPAAKAKGFKVVLGVWYFSWSPFQLVPLIGADLRFHPQARLR